MPTATTLTAKKLTTTWNTGLAAYKTCCPAAKPPKKPAHGSPRTASATNQPALVRRGSHNRTICIYVSGTIAMPDFKNMTAAELYELHNEVADENPAQVIAADFGGQQPTC